MKAKVSNASVTAAIADFGLTLHLLVHPVLSVRRDEAGSLVDLDARLKLDWAGLGDKVYVQLNVTNLFDKLYVGGFDGQLADNSVPFTQIGSPRTFIGSLVVGF